MPTTATKTALILASISTVLLTAGCGGGSSGPHVAAGSATPGATPATSALAYSRCMRSHGVADFPDPNSNGDVALNAGPGSDLDFNDPRFKAAEGACRQLEPTHGTPAQQARDYANGLRFAACMRSHGVPAFPDPQPPGTGPVTQSNAAGAGSAGPGGVDPRSPQFAAASAACRHFLPQGAGSQLSSSGAGS
jgi:hypothetical protein